MTKNNTDSKHTPGPRMTPAQRRFVDRCRTEGPQRSPTTSGRASVSARSAWFRTAESCARNGWVTVERTSATEYVATAVSK